MSFIETDEFILLFDHPDHGTPATVPGNNQVPLDALRRLREVGVKTVLQFPFWSEIEKTPENYDWSTIDAYVEKARAAEMKTLLMTYDRAVTWAPPHWYLRGSDGTVFNGSRGFSIFSPWNHEAQAYSEAFIKKVIDRYSAADVCCICGLGKEGETVLPPGGRAYFDEAAIADYRAWAQRLHEDSLDRYNASNATDFSDWPQVIPLAECRGDTRDWLRESVVRYVVRQQKIFAPAHDEIWLMLHRAFEWDSGNFCMDEIYQALHSHVSAKMYGIQFTHFPAGLVMAEALRDQREFGIEIFAGSEWPEGLAPHTPKAIRQGLRGLITAPLHPFAGHRRMEEWMFAAFKSSSEAFALAQNGELHPT